MKLMWMIEGANGELRRLVCRNSKGDTLVSLWVGEEVAKDVTAKQAQADWYTGGLEKITAWKRAAADWQDRAQRAERQSAELTERLDRASLELSAANARAAQALKQLEETRAGHRTIEAAAARASDAAENYFVIERGPPEGEHRRYWWKRTTESWVSNPKEATQWLTRSDADREIERRNFVGGARVVTLGEALKAESEPAPPMPAAHSDAALDIVRHLRWLKEDIEYRLEKIGPQVDRLAGVVARPGPASGGDQVAPAPNAPGAG